MAALAPLWLEIGAIPDLRISSSSCCKGSAQEGLHGGMFCRSKASRSNRCSHCGSADAFCGFLISNIHAKPRLILVE